MRVELLLMYNKSWRPECWSKWRVYFNVGLLDVVRPYLSSQTSTIIYTDDSCDNRMRPYSYLVEELGEYRTSSRDSPSWATKLSPVEPQAFAGWATNDHLLSHSIGTTRIEHVRIQLLNGILSTSSGPPLPGYHGPNQENLKRGQIGWTTGNQTIRRNKLIITAYVMERAGCNRRLS